MMSTEDMKEWTEFILGSIRTEQREAVAAATAAASALTKGEEGGGATSPSKNNAPAALLPPGTILNHTWREALLALKDKYPLTGASSTGRGLVELGLGKRIVEMRAHLEQVTRAKTAKKLAILQQRNQHLEGIALAGDGGAGAGGDMGWDPAEAEPNIYAASVVNLVRQQRRQNAGASRGRSDSRGDAVGSLPNSIGMSQGGGEVRRADNPSSSFRRV